MKRLSALLLAGFSSGTLLAVPLQTTGIKTQQSAGAGITQSKGAASLLHNPGNLIKTRGLELYYEVSGMNLYHKFVPAEEKLPIAETTVNAPPLTLGVSYKDRPSPWAYGFIFTPTGSGSKQTIEKIPMQIVENAVRWLGR